METPGHPFAIHIIGQDRRLVQETKGEVGLAHGEKWRLRIVNYGPTRAAFHISLGGTQWEPVIVLPAGHTADIETVPGTGQHLTFFAAGTREAEAAGQASLSRENFGLVSARITRERWQHNDSKLYFDQDQIKPPVTLTVRLVHDLQRYVVDAVPIPGRA